MIDRKKAFERQRYSGFIEEASSHLPVIERAVAATSEAIEAVREVIRIDMSDTLGHLQDAMKLLEEAIDSIHGNVRMYERLGELDGEDLKVIGDV